MNSIVQTASAIFINDDEETYFSRKIKNLLTDSETSYVFGVFSMKFLKVSSDPLKNIILNVLIDMSSSMRLMTSQMPQQELVNLIVKNIVRTLSSESTKISLTITGFDDVLHDVQPIIEISPESCEVIKSNIDTKLIPTGGTNIENPIRHMHDITREQLESNFSPCNLLLTDGEENIGSGDPEFLKEFIVPGVPHAFVGVGTTCNEILLSSLGRETPDGLGDYYFVANAEDSAIVIAKIIAEFLHTTAKNINIVVTNAEIYDYSTRSWSNSLVIPKITDKVLRTFHLRALPENIDKVSIMITADSLTEPKIVSCEEIQIVAPTETIKYEMARHIVLNLLHQAFTNTSWKDFMRCVPFEQDTYELKRHMKICYSEINIYIMENSSKKRLYERLLNDLYFASKVLSTLKSKNVCEIILKANGIESSFTPIQPVAECVPYVEPCVEPFDINDYCAPTNCGASFGYSDHCLYISPFEQFEELTHFRGLESFSNEIIHTPNVRLCLEYSTEEELKYINSATSGLMTEHIREVLSETEEV
jgi:hypothetical protein